MNFKQVSKLLVISLVIVLLVASCSKDSNESSSKRSRREDTDSSKDTKKTLPALSTTAPPSNIDTKPITELPVLTGNEISSEWDSSKLCSLISPVEIQKILAMATTPTPTYFYSESSGARCTYSSGAGDEVYIEFSTQTYGDARAVDTALNAEGKQIVAQGVGGVSKTNKATGTTYELNYSGLKANEWIVNSPSDDKTDKLAKLLITALS